MHPIIAKLGPFTIYSYGLALALAFVTAAALARTEAKRKGLNPDIIFNFLFLVFISGVIGARIFYIIENFGFYAKNPLEAVMLERGGLAWFGGLIAATIVGVAYLRKKRLFVYKTLDLIVPFVALGQAIGRIGCLLNGCCFGRESWFGIYFKTHSAILLPTQAYSSLLLILIFIILRFLQERPHKAGEIFFTYLLLYSLKRFFIEFWRADNPHIFLGFSLFHILSLFLLLSSLISLILIRKAKN